MKKSALIVIIVFTFITSALADDYDPQHTMLALNMAVVSVHRIINSQSRAILDDEYQNIINNLSLGNIRSDPEITKLYERLLDITSRKKLRTDEAEYLRKNYNDQAKRSLSGALSDLGKNSAAMIREDGSISAFFGSFSSLVSVGAASYFKYQSGGVNLRGSLEDNLYRLNAEDLADFNEIQKQLLTSSWNLLNTYNLPDDYRLVQSSVDDFCKAVENSESPSQLLRMLQAMEDDFRVYPPYWFYRAKAARDIKDDDEYTYSLERFNEVWRPVLRRDPFMLEAAKFRISDIVNDGVPFDDDTRRRVLELCEVMRDNTMRDDWVNNIFAGAVYYALGEKDEGMRCVAVNLDFSFERELSSQVYSNMNNNVPPSLVLSEALRSLKLHELTADMTSDDRITALMIADYFDDREGALGRLSFDRRSPVVLHALRVDALRSSDPAKFGTLRELTESLPLSGDYGEFMPLLRAYSDDEKPGALVMLADMYHYGVGVSEDVEAAMRFYDLAGQRGEVYAQKMYSALLMTERVSKQEDVNVNEAVPAETKKPERKEKKPLIRFWPFKK